MSENEELPRVVGAYLDNSALIDIACALDGEWAPPSLMTDGDHRLLSAAQLTLYAHRDRNGWVLVSSGVARKENLRGLALAWLESQIHEIPHGNDDPSAADIGVLVARYREAGLHERDSEHAAEAASRPWIRYFVTNDDRILQRAHNVPLDHELAFITVERAAELLDIQAGEMPSSRPAPSNPLSKVDPWWVPAAVAPAAAIAPHSHVVDPSVATGHRTERDE